MSTKIQVIIICLLIIKVILLVVYFHIQCEANECVISVKSLIVKDKKNKTNTKLQLIEIS